MSLLFKTNYATCNGPLDEPLFKTHGLHAGSGSQRVIIMQDPLGIYGKVIRFRVDGGGQDTVFGTTNADRSEVLPAGANTNFSATGLNEIFLASRLLLKDYRSNSADWNLCGFEIHDAVAGATQSPVGSACSNNNQFHERLWGGPVSSNGLTGTIRINVPSVTWPDTQHWVSLVQHIKFSPDPNVGIFQCWLNGNKIWDYKTATITGNHGGYLKTGLYRGTTQLTTMYYETDLGCFTTLTEAFAFVNETGGGGGGPPPPPPPEETTEFDVEPANYLGGAYVVSTRTQHGSQANKQRCYKAVVQNSGTVTALGTYREAQQNTGTETVKLAVWPDNGTGTDPGSGSPLGFTSELAFTSASAVGRYSANVTVPFGVSSGQIVWIGELSGGTANLAFTRAANSGLFRLMDAAYTSGVVAWDTTTDSEFPLDLTTWMTGTLGAGQPPVDVTAPVITGSAVLGSTLTLTSVGTWSGPAPTFTYSWQRFNSPSSVTDLNQHGTTYVTQPADRGLKIVCLVIATTALGTKASMSNQIGPIFTVAAREPVGHRVGGRTVRAGRRAGEGGGGV